MAAEGETPTVAIRAGQTVQRFLRRNLANFITLGRIPLCFASFACAVMVLLKGVSIYGFLGLLLLVATALTDYFDGYVARRLQNPTKLGALADQMLDKMVYCIIFPTIAVGVMQRDGAGNMGHVILCLVLCVTMLVRDHYVSFLRSVADRHQADTSVRYIGKIRTIWALPTACVLFAYCYARGGPDELAYLNALILWPQNVDIKYLIVLEITLIVINLVSAISYTRSYGSCLLDDVCEGDVSLRRRILAVLPNSLTLMNAGMGVAAVFLAQAGKFHMAYVLLVLAAIFDKLDGAAARKLGLVEELPADGQRRITVGMVLDDISDFISFCFAPTLIACAYFERNPALASYPLVGTGMLLLWTYTFCGLARLVYFTLDKSPIPGFFKGMPTPAAALLVGGVVRVTQFLDPDCLQEWSRWLVLGVFVLAGLLMNSYFVSYVHFGRLMSRSPLLTWTVFGVVLLGIFSVNYLGFIGVGLMSVYLFSPLFIRPDLRQADGGASPSAH